MITGTALLRIEALDDVLGETRKFKVGTAFVDDLLLLTEDMVYELVYGLSLGKLR